MRSSASSVNFRSPASSVKKEVKARRLVRAAEPGQYELNMELRMYRERQGSTRRVKPGAQALWNFLTEAEKIDG